MTYIKKYGILLIIILSMVLNGIFYLRLKEANEKIVATNQMVSQQVEQRLRQSISYINEFRGNQAVQTMQNLQGSLQDLTTAFDIWRKLNETEHNPNLPMQKTLASLELLKNGVTQHLSVQYTGNQNTLREYDLVYLEKAQNSLGNLLTVYHNVKDYVGALKDDSETDGGMTQVAASLEEITKLYRHSLTPNAHPTYISLDEAVAAAEEAYPQLKGETLQEGVITVQIKDGVHYYPLNYQVGKNPSHVVWVDAINGQIRNFEEKQSNGDKTPITQEEAIEIARKYFASLYEGEYTEEMFKMKVEDGNRQEIYAFRFTPKSGEIELVSDAYIIHVSSLGGKITKVASDFTQTPVPYYEQQISQEAIYEQHIGEYGNMVYRGLGVIRSFQTNYKARVAYSFSVVQNEQPMLVFFDTETGRLIYQLYYLYEGF